MVLIYLKIPYTLYIIIYASFKVKVSDLSNGENKFILGKFPENW